MNKKLIILFMRLVVNALDILMMMGLGYSQAMAYHAWDSYRLEFLSELNKEE